MSICISGVQRWSRVCGCSLLPRSTPDSGPAGLLRRSWHSRRHQLDQPEPEQDKEPGKKSILRSIRREALHEAHRTSAERYHAAYPWGQPQLKPDRKHRFVAVGQEPRQRERPKRYSAYRLRPKKHERERPIQYADLAVVHRLLDGEYQRLARASNAPFRSIATLEPQRAATDPRSPAWLAPRSRWRHTRMMRARLLLQGRITARQPFQDIIRSCHIKWSRAAIMPERLFCVEPVVYSRGSFQKHSDRRETPFRHLTERCRYAWFPAFTFIAGQHCGAWATLDPSRLRLRFDFGRHVKKHMTRARTDIFRTAHVLNAWESLGPHQQRRNWLSALLLALRCDLHVAVALLSVALQQRSRVIPQYAAADSIALLCHIILDQQPYVRWDDSFYLDDPDASCRHLAELYFNHYARTTHKEPFTPYILGLLGQSADGPQVMVFARHLRSLNSSPDLQLAVRATQIGEANLALGLLRSVPKEVMASKQATTACTAMLNLRISSQEEYAQRMHMLTAMLELGLRPDERLRDAIVRLALLGRDYELAWQTHQQALENGLVPTAQTYTYLLDGVQGHMNINNILWISRETQRQGLLESSVQLGTAIVRALFRAYIFRPTPRLYDALLNSYAKIFDTGPLYDLGIVRNRQSECSLPPTNAALQRVLSAWVNENFDKRAIRTVFERWVDLNELGVSRAALTIEEPDVFRTFIVQALRLNDTQLSFEVLHAFLDGARTKYTSLRPSIQARLKAADRQHSSPIKFRVETYTDIIHSLSRKGEMEQAEEVVRVMQERGVELDGVVYEVLLLGYSKLQNIGNAVRILVDKLEAGFGTDDWTSRALARIDNREALRIALKRAEFRSSLPDKPTLNGKTNQ